MVAISDQSGTILEKRHYGVWDLRLRGELLGEVREGEVLIKRPQTHYWTGHEHFAQVSLVHMNGRMYDADLGRFLAPDNYVQDPSNTQNFNRYQYAFNNPLKWTDPSGNLAFLAAVAIGALIGAASYSISAAITGNFSWGDFFKSAAIGALSGALSWGIGEIVQTMEVLNAIGTATLSSKASFGTVAFQVGAHAAVGGSMSSLQGGNFWTGAAAGGISSGISRVAGALTERITGSLRETAKNMSNFIRDGVSITVGALSGGIGSALAGGNFWDGVRQGAITAGLNHAVHKGLDYIGKQVQKSLNVEKLLDKAMEYNVGDQISGKEISTWDPALKKVDSFIKYVVRTEDGLAPTLTFGGKLAVSTLGKLVGHKVKSGQEIKVQLIDYKGESFYRLTNLNNKLFGDPLDIYIKDTYWKNNLADEYVYPIKVDIK